MTCSFKVGDLLALSEKGKVWRWGDDINDVFKRKPMPWKIKTITYLFYFEESGDEFGFSMPELWEVVSGANVCDVYKAHEEQMKSNPGYQQFLLNEERCALCGEKGVNRVVDGVGEVHSIEWCAGVYVHVDCRNLINSFGTVSGDTDVVSVISKLNVILKKKPQKSQQREEEKIECFGDHSGNPWNRK